jgi:hypothetical protein
LARLEHHKAHPTLAEVKRKRGTRTEPRRFWFVVGVVACQVEEVCYGAISGTSPVWPM